MTIANLVQSLVNTATEASAYVCNLAEGYEIEPAVTAIAVAGLAYGCQKAAPWAKRQIQNCADRLVPLAPNVAEALHVLHAVNPALLTRENRAAMVASGMNALEVASGIRILHDDNPALVTQENFDALIASGENPYWVALGMGALHTANPALLTRENRAALIGSGANAREVAIGIRNLHTANPVLETQENFDALIASGDNDISVVDGVNTLCEFNITRHACDRASCSHTSDKNINLAIGIIPNFGACRLFVNRRIRWIFKLLW